MEITTDELLKLLGAKEVELFLLKKQAAALQQALDLLAAKQPKGDGDGGTDR